MAAGNRHYEAAFEDFLRSRQAQYVAVSETHRALFAGVKVKSFDFLVAGRGGGTLIVDIKGRRAPGDGSAGLQNWVTRDDVDGLQRWEEVFGTGFAALLLFAYWLSEPPAEPGPEVHVYEGACYRFLGVRLADYAAGMRERSPKWGTVNVPSGFFREISRPASEFL